MDSHAESFHFMTSSGKPMINLIHIELTIFVLIGLVDIFASWDMQLDSECKRMSRLSYIINNVPIGWRCNEP